MLHNGPLSNNTKSHTSSSLEVNKNEFVLKRTITQSFGGGEEAGRSCETVVSH